MIRVTQLSSYADDQDNVIEYGGLIERNVQIKFTGSHNRLVVADDAKIGKLTVDFDCDHGLLRIGGHHGVPAFSGSIRIGQDSTVVIGNNVSTTATCVMSATEGTTITIGDDVMFASENQVRADDGHPIFDVFSGKRVNPSRSIAIGSHVWLARGAVVLGGVTIGDGTVVGYGSLVTKNLPNNCIAAGVPARVTRRNAAWERPHLSMTKPYYKPDSSTVTRSPYWHRTESVEDELPKVGASLARARLFGRRSVRPVLARAARRWSRRGNS